jgi:competence protein ComEC
LPVPVLLACLFLGAARYQAAQPRLAPDFIAWYNDTRVEMAVVGLVAAPPDHRDTYTNLRVEVERVRPGGSLYHTAVRGLLLVRVPPGGDWRYGDRLVLRGELENPPADEGFSYREYLARQGVYAYMPKGQAARLAAGQGNPALAALYALKARAQDVVYQIYPDPEASLLAGILLGVETGIPEPVQAAFKETGTSHVIAISGFNMTILAGLFASGFGRWLGPRWGAGAAVLGLGSYTILVGADAAVVRAALMGGLGIFARQVGRRQAALNSLAFTAALMALANPQVPWDIGFQLSFAATLGLVLYADPLSALFVRWAARALSEEHAQRLAGPIGEYFLFTLAAQVTTLPVTIYHFQRVSLISFLANPAILPVQPPVMILGGTAVLIGLVALPLGKAAASLVWPFAVYTIRVVEFFAGIPDGVLVLGRVSVFGVVLFYAVLLIVTFKWEQVRAWRTVLTPAASISALAILTVLTWRAALAAPDGRLHLTVLDVGQGDGVLIQSPTGRYLVIDGGSRTTTLSDALGRRLPVGSRGLDYLVVAAPFPEQIGGVPGILARFPPEAVLWAGPVQASRAARMLGESVSDAGIPVLTAEPGQRLDLGAGAYVEVLAVGKRGAVLLVAWDRFRALLPIGLDFDGLEGLGHGREVGPVTALLLADGGYAPLTPPAWLAHLQPEVVLLSVGAGAYRTLPSPETLDLVAGYTVLRTDKNGWIKLMTDGERLWLAVER